MTRPFLFGTNFKMNQTPTESARFLAELAPSLRTASETQCFMIPPFTSLPAAVAERARFDSDHARPLWIGAQNMHQAPSGAFTGEISAAMLAALNVDLVLLGHAERRTLFGETDHAIRDKTKAALAAGLRVLLCVGETADEKRDGVGPETVARQLKIAFLELDSKSAPMLQVAYEPVWSIGSNGIPATPEDIEPIAAHMRRILVDRLGAGGTSIPILYGGSVSPENAATFSAIPEIGGLFVGRAAWTVAGFNAVLTAASGGES